MLEKPEFSLKETGYPFYWFLLIAYHDIEGA